MRRINQDAISNRVKTMLDLRNEILKDVNYFHVKLQQGNTKTGKKCYTVSLIPILDCKNCAECRKDCYDIRNVCWQPGVQRDRAKNSAIHLADIERYYDEISMQIKANFVSMLRLNVGGDVSLRDFDYINKVAKENPRTDILFFTKSYDDINEWLDTHSFEANVHPIVSRWLDVFCWNKHNLPESHVLWEDGKTTAPEYGSTFCGGNCEECHWNETGCWTLKSGESVIFKAH